MDELCDSLINLYVFPAIFAPNQALIHEIKITHCLLMDESEFLVVICLAAYVARRKNMYRIKSPTLVRSAQTSVMIVFAVIALFIATTAGASTVNAQSVIYFDSQNNIIGQQMIDCHNWEGHAGNVNPSNPYKIQEQWHCSSVADVQCSGGSANGAPPSCVVLNDPGPAWTLEYFATATGATYDYYCASGNQPGTEFIGHPECQQMQPVYFLTPFLPGWN